jgi:hypothetical protein
MSDLTSFRVRDMVAAAAIVVIAIGGLLALRFAPAVASGDDAAEAAQEFRAEVADESKAVKGMIDETKAGKNLSDFRVGMFMMSLLNNLSDRDDTLGAYFHKDGRLMEDYLRNTFQYHSEDEVAHVAAMAKDGNPAIRESARYALESLRHIPDEKDPPESQVKDRAALAESLTALEASLTQAAGE